MSGPAAFMQNLGAGATVPPDAANAVFQDIAHAHRPDPAPYQAQRIAPVARLLCLPLLK